MGGLPRRVLTRFLPMLLLVIVYAAWMADVQEGGPWLVRNLFPIVACLVLLLASLVRNSGHFAAEDSRWILATVGFAIPSIGLSAYLHYAYAVNLNDMFSASQSPESLFRFLPVYTSVAGGIGAAIGWIVGRSLHRSRMK